MYPTKHMELQKQIKQEVKEFIKSGGVIEQVAPHITASSTKSRKTPSKEFFDDGWDD